jgi:hypothetical protein
LFANQGVDSQDSPNARHTKIQLLRKEQRNGEAAVGFAPLIVDNL